LTLEIFTLTASSVSVSRILSFSSKLERVPSSESEASIGDVYLLCFITFTFLNSDTLLLPGFGREYFFIGSGAVILATVGVSEGVGASEGTGALKGTGALEGTGVIANVRALVAATALAVAGVGALTGCRVLITGTEHSLAGAVERDEYDEAVLSGDWRSEKATVLEGRDDELFVPERGRMGDRDLSGLLS
jgi:hypothetical protein